MVWLVLCYVDFITYSDMTVVTHTSLLLFYLLPHVTITHFLICEISNAHKRCLYYEKLLKYKPTCCKEWICMYDSRGKFLLLWHMCSLDKKRETQQQKISGNVKLYGQCPDHNTPMVVSILKQSSLILRFFHKRCSYGHGTCNCLEL